jgi:hypothetical protein
VEHLNLFDFGRKLFKPGSGSKNHSEIIESTTQCRNQHLLEKKSCELYAQMLITQPHRDLPAVARVLTPDR